MIRVQEEAKVRGREAHGIDPVKNWRKIKREEWPVLYICIIPLKQIFIAFVDKLFYSLKMKGFYKSNQIPLA